MINIGSTIKLNNGIQMPVFGLGVWKSSEGGEVESAVDTALKIGYRSIDTAAIYQNEKGVGQAIRNSEIPRKEIFVTSKVWNSDQGYDSTLKAFERSLEKLGFEYLDLYLIHWPVKGKYKETWKALIDIYLSGRVKSIGVSNFLRHHLEDLLASTDHVPSVNQVELHPYLIQQDLIDYCESKNIRVEAWSPLMQGRINEVEVLNEIGEKYQKTAAQIVLRWNLQRKIITIPKSSNPRRIQENATIFDFELSTAEVQQINALEKHHRFGPDPDNFNF